LYICDLGNATRTRHVRRNLSRHADTEVVGESQHCPSAQNPQLCTGDVSAVSGQLHTRSVRSAAVKHQSVEASRETVTSLTATEHESNISATRVNCSSSDTLGKSSVAKTITVSRSATRPVVIRSSNCTATAMPTCTVVLRSLSSPSGQPTAGNMTLVDKRNEKVCATSCRGRRRKYRAADYDVEPDDSASMVSSATACEYYQQIRCFIEL